MITKKNIFICLIVLAVFLLTIEGVGFYLHLTHNKLFFGEIAVLALAAGFVLFVLGFLIGFFLARDENYYKNLRTQPRLIETRKSDWVKSYD